MANGSAREGEMVWLADGAVEPIPDTKLSGLATPALSPDGTRVAYSAELNGNRDVWVLDLDRGGRVRLSFDSEFDVEPVWLPDGSGVLWRCGTTLCLRSLDGSAEVRRVTNGFQGTVAADSRTLIFTRWGSGSRNDLWTMPLEGGEPSLLLATPFEESDPRLSPGGDLLAYVSDESGRQELMLRPYPEGAARWQVSVGGGTLPRWSADGEELYYFGGSELRAVPIHPAPGPAPGTPRTVAAWTGGRFGIYDVAPDGRVLALRRLEAPEGATERGIVLAEGWLEDLAGRRSP